MSFISMWRQADLIDAAIGGVDSIPPEEYHDYVEACLMALSDDFEKGKKMKKSRGKHGRQDNTIQGR